jgi:hypothetical protein
MRSRTVSAGEREKWSLKVLWDNPERIGHFSPRSLLSRAPTICSEALSLDKVQARKMHIDLLA